MKKKNFVLSFLLIISLFYSDTIFAHSSQENFESINPEITYNDDGSYVITTLEIIPSSRTTNVISGKKTATAYNSNDVAQWSFTLSATFHYEKGITATCTSVSHAHSIFNSDWTISSESSSKSGNVAYGTATGKKTILFITTEEKTVDVQISCDSNGTLH